MRTFPRIVFFGTPEFAVFSLWRIIGSGYTVAGVVTAPDKPAGRGLQLRVSPVKLAALELGIPVVQPVSLKDPVFLDQLSSWRPDIQIIIAFRMLPRIVWSLPPLGTVNLHASVLPQYRGAAPINWALINGERETGVTTFFLDDQIDTGKIIATSGITIAPDESAGQLHDRLMTTGAELVIKTIDDIISGSARMVPQDEIIDHFRELKKAPKLTKEHCRIDWNLEVEQIHNQVRGLSPHPGAYSELPMNDGNLLLCKILKVSFETCKPEFEPGKIFSDGKSYLSVSGKNGFIQILEIQPAGRKPLKIEAFLNGAGRMFV
ncbi:MAG: methionyl-tRNA formyltransferase [bacterium]